MDAYWLWAYKHPNKAFVLENIVIVSIIGAMIFFVLKVL